MHNDKTTLKDLSVIASDEKSVFSLIDYTTTKAGKEVLQKMLYQPPGDFELLQKTQDVIKFWTDKPDKWTDKISNGTLVMLEKFFESAENATVPPSGVNLVLGTFFQKLLNRNEYFFTQFSVSHITDFLKGCKELAAMLSDELPVLLRTELELVKKELEHRFTEELLGVNEQTPFKQLTKISYKARREMKQTVYRMIQYYARLDAWHSLALATQKNNWAFPKLSASLPVHYEAEALYHPLLTKPVSYDIVFREANFLLLTGANMSGKTTFMRAIGVGALLAHLGMGVPAKKMQLSFLQGIITNMHVEDDLLHGESFFFAEVKRMKQTAERIVQSQPHLVLMDELFKGTNVHDAYECTRGVAEGLLQHPNHVMILSTHLHEVAQHFNERNDIQFAYFVTQMQDNHYRFTYELKQGISNDRIGYKILQNEGVLDLLKKKSN